MFDGLDQLLDFVKVSRFTQSTAYRVATIQMTGAGAAGDDEHAEVVDACEVVQPLGLMASPALGANTEALVARLGDNPVALAIVDKSRPAQDVEEGEVRLYGVGSGNATANVRVRNSGAVEVNAKANANVALNVDGTGDVVLDGGSLKVARVTDAVTAGATMATWIAALTTFVNGTAPGTLVLPTDFGTIATSGGAAHVKA